MAKRSTGQFARRKHDLYRTWDKRALPPLLPHLKPGTRFIEPCAGHGDLIKQLADAGHHCVAAFDIKPPRVTVAPLPAFEKADATKDVIGRGIDFDCYITNPAWTRQILHAIILNLYWQKETWLLFDADWLHTEQSRPYLPLLRQVVSVGRLKWFEGSKNDGKDNCAWYRFGAPDVGTIFTGRA